MTEAARLLSSALAGRYRLERELGQGGMATVYLAYDERHSRQVALKILHPQVAALLGSERFQREITTTARLNHPNILPLFDSGTDQGIDWYVMPYFTGSTLSDRLKQAGPLPLPEATRIFGDIAGALDYAHRQGVLHRDLKPANVLLQDDRAVLADFGIALPVGAESTRLTESGLTLGTPEYMSPEQATAERALDARSDVYALGCVLYEMLAGEPPFTGPTAQAVLARRLRDPVPPISTVRDIPPGVEAAITRALGRNPADRFKSVAEFAAAITTATATAPRLRRSASPALRLVAAALLVVVTAAVSWRWLRRPGVALDPNLIVVLPARVNAPGQSLDYLREGLLDFAAVKLTGEGGPRAADPRATLAAWQSLGTREDAARAIALRLGAGKVLDASVVGDGRRVTITAGVTDYPGGLRRSPVSVAGSPDSLDLLVDQLMIRVLALQSGEAQRPLTGITSLPAWRAYFEGKAAHRQGRYRDAVQAYQQALDIDSTFALAALGMIPSIWRTSGVGDEAAAARIVLRHLSRLSPTDRIWFQALEGAHYPGPETGVALLAAREEAARRLPDRADAWFELGDWQLHFGPQVDLPDHRTRARQSLERALALDSTFALPIDHLLLLAFADRDTASIRRLFRLYQIHDSLGDRAGFFAWRSAIALGDSAALQKIRSRFARMPTETLTWIVSQAQNDGIGLDDAARVLEAWGARAATDGERGTVRGYARRLALNRGRPTEAARFYPPPSGDNGWVAIREALWWQGDSVSGALGAREIEKELAQRGGARLAADEWTAAWYLAAWQIAAGRTAAAGATIRQLRAHFPDDWPAWLGADRDFAPLVLETWLAATERRADASALLARLDSTQATSPTSVFYDEANLVLGELLEASGDPGRAYRAYGRMLFDGDPSGPFRSTFLLEHARLGAQLGHREDAIEEYQVYLALRSDPEPDLVPARDSARAELARLTSR